MILQVALGVNPASGRLAAKPSNCWSLGASKKRAKESLLSLIYRQCRLVEIYRRASVSFDWVVQNHSCTEFYILRFVFLRHVLKFMSLCSAIVFLIIWKHRLNLFKLSQANLSRWLHLSQDDTPERPPKKKRLERHLGYNFQRYAKKGISLIFLFWGWDFSTINPTLRKCLDSIRDSLSWICRASMLQSGHEPVISRVLRFYI